MSRYGVYGGSKLIVIMLSFYTGPVKLNMRPIEAGKIIKAPCLLVKAELLIMSVSKTGTTNQQR